jgi:acyl carrier protein
MIERIKSILAEQLGMDADEIADNATMAELAVDSLDKIELAMYIEDEFGLSFSDNEAAGLITDDMTVADLAEAVERLVQG